MNPKTNLSILRLNHSLSLPMTQHVFGSWMINLFSRGYSTLTKSSILYSLQKIGMGTIFRYLGYMGTKWIIFYSYQYFESGKSWSWNKMDNAKDYYFTAWMLLILPAVELVVMIFPFYLSLKQKGWILLVALISTFVLEFAIGWYATNQQLSTWMVVKIFLSVGLFWLFYKNQLEF